MSFGDNALSDNEKAKLKDFVDSGVKVHQDIDQRKEDIKVIEGGLKDTAKLLGEELNVDAKLLLKAVTTAHKETLSEEREKMDTLELILAEVGRA